MNDLADSTYNGYRKLFVNLVVAKIGRDLFGAIRCCSTTATKTIRSTTILPQD